MEQGIIHASIGAMSSNPRGGNLEFEKAAHNAIMKAGEEYLAAMDRLIKEYDIWLNHFK